MFCWIICKRSKLLVMYQCLSLTEVSFFSTHTKNVQVSVKLLFHLGSQVNLNHVKSYVCDI